MNGIRKIEEDSKGYLLEEYGFKSLEDLDLFYAHLLETARNEKDAAIMKPAVIATWYQIREEFIECEKLFSEEADDERADREDLEKIRSSVVAKAADHIDRRLTN